MRTSMLSAFQRFSLSAFALAALLTAATASAQLVVDYNFTSGATVPDNGQYADVRTLGGLASFSNVAVSLNLTTSNGGDPMWLGDMYSSLTFGTGVEAN